VLDKVQWWAGRVVKYPYEYCVATIRGTDMPCELCAAESETVLWQNENCRVVLVADDDYPGFCRVIWQQHIKEMTDLKAVEQQYLMRVVFAVERALREVLQPDKINLASLGNVTPHLHWHVIPRFVADKNFPNPIWGKTQREAMLTPPLDWKIRLNKTIQKEISAC